MGTVLSELPKLETLPAGWLFLGFNWNIDAYAVSRLAQTLGAAQHDKVPGVTLVLSSHGGSPEQALFLANLIRGFPLPIYTHNNSTVQSAANLVYLAGHKRFADPKSTFMFHRTVFNAQSASLTPDQLALQSDGIKNADQVTLDWLAERSGHPASVFETILTGDKLHTAAEGHSLGFVDHIRELDIPKDARYIHINLDAPKP